MNKGKSKGKIYLRTFSAFLAIYLILMFGFTKFLVEQEKKIASESLKIYVLQANNIFVEVLQDNIDNQNQLIDIPQLRKTLVSKSAFLASSATEVALYTGEYERIFNTNGYWDISFIEYKGGIQAHGGYANLNPNDWFSEKEVKELEGYLHANPKPKKVGDLSGYNLVLEGLWFDNEMVIPEKINVIPMTADKFDEQGNLIGSTGKLEERIVYTSGYENTRDLPYFERGNIYPAGMGNYIEYNAETQSVLRNKVLDKERLQNSLQDILGVSYDDISYDRVGLLTYHYYYIHPYNSTITRLDDGTYYSEFLMVFAREVNILKKLADTFAFVWIASFIVLLIVAIILARQTDKTIQKRDELIRYRKEMTDALAHDLKTPLSIISGYAQNLIENINMDKKDQYAINIQNNVERMDRVIRQILDLSKLEADTSSIKIREISLNRLSSEVISRYEQTCSERNITVGITGDKTVGADPELLKRVIDNFFINAIYNTPDGGRIQIKISNNLFEIFNSDSQIPEEELDAIWQPYKKIDKSRSNTRGTGLGLAIASNILELFKFSYGARNCQDGVVFWFKFEM